MQMRTNLKVSLSSSTGTASRNDTQAVAGRPIEISTRPRNPAHLPDTTAACSSTAVR
jgi:hypothetical protein